MIDLKNTIDKLTSELRIDDGYFQSWKSNIAVCFQDAYSQFQNKKNIHEISNIAAERFLDVLCLKTADRTDVADRLYKFVNPESKMCTPNSVYESVDKWYYEWQKYDGDLDLFDWIVENKKG